MESLTKKKQDIILLVFFLNMTNANVATFKNQAESPLHYRRKNALDKLKKFIEEHLYES